MTTTLPIALVVAIAKNGIIGAQDTMPWKLTSDLKRFKRDTIGKPIIMGRKTFDSIGRALPGRLNIVVSRSIVDANDIVHADSVERALELADVWAKKHDASEICVIGGGQIYRETIAMASKLYVTHVMAEPLGDTYFPEINQSHWTPVLSEKVPMNDKDTAQTLYVIYERT